MEKYLYLSLVFLICSYLSPNDEYKKYFQFILGVFLAVAILQPLSDRSNIRPDIGELIDKIEGVSYEPGKNEGAFIEAFEFKEN